jgi:adenine-specific DNA-methyltransferase
MPTLDWIGKKAVVNHHREVPYRLLHCDKGQSAGDADAGNLLVQGDNLLALKALLPYYAGKVKCIYIDPPYNTGNENWVYNDNVNSPEIRQWLGRVVGKEAEDLSRHDKWLCMMYPRLALLKEFLSEDGAIFISIDDSEQSTCKLLCDEIYGGQNFVSSIVWHKRVSPANDAKFFSTDHDFILVYALDKRKWHPNRLTRNQEQLGYYTNPDNDERGPWNSAAYTCAKTADERPNLYYPIINPNTKEVVWPNRSRVWAYDAASHQRNVEEKLLWWGKGGKAKMPRIKRFLHHSRLVVPRSIWTHQEAGHNQEAKLEILKLFPNKPFTTPKPVRLLRRILDVGTDKESLILDSFAGSGTTGHGMMALNQADGGTRRFILVEMDENICRDVTAQRLMRVIDGDADVAGLGGGYLFCTLGEPLFDALGQIREGVKFPDLAAHIFFTETGTPIPKRTNGKTPLIGVHDGRAVYLLFNGVLGDKRPNGGNVLTGDVLRRLPTHDGPKIIYGESCRLGADRLRREGVVFKQVPYEIKVS